MAAAMSPSTGRLLAAMGYNDCPAARWPAGPTSPVSAKRTRRDRPLDYFKVEYRRRTPDELRAAMRDDVLGNARRLADPVNDWDREQLERNRAHHVLRYRLALSAMRALPPLPFPAEPAPKMFCVQELSPRPVPALRLVKNEENVHA